MFGKVEAKKHRVADILLVEFLATYMILYSGLQVTSERDLLTQFTPLLTIIATMMCLKDQYYMIPDASTMTTVILAFNAAYTDQDGNTDWQEILTRIAGQAMAWITTLLTYALPHWQRFERNSPKFDTTLHSFNEIIATAIESMATAWLILPLLGTYDTKEGFKAKKESHPPAHSTVFRVSTAIAITHYCLERLFHTSMNPFAYTLQLTVNCQAKEDCSLSSTIPVVAGQLLGLTAACLYTTSYFPGTKTIKCVNQ